MVEVKFSSCPVSLISVPSSSCYSIISFIYSSFFSFSNRGIVALGQTRLKPSSFWWRRRLCVSNPRKPSTPAGWITSSSCLCPWIRLPMQVSGSGLLPMHGGQYQLPLILGGRPTTGPLLGAVFRVQLCETLLLLSFFWQKNSRKQSAGVRRGTPPPRQFGLKSPSPRAWRPSASQRSSQTSGARLCRPRLPRPSIKRGSHPLRARPRLTFNIEIFVSFARTTRFASFPDHLVIQIKKFTFGLDWVPKKLGKNVRKEKFLSVAKLGKVSLC